ncbi:MAG TPA: hypothetical protein VM093_07045 [Aeromicrobium sp.]|nr:hypothetical protein [Aeromicrobium sp.]
MPMERAICPHCGSGDVEALLPTRQPHGHDGVFADLPSAQRHCLVCGVRWELDDIDLGERLA